MTRRALLTHIATFQLLSGKNIGLFSSKTGSFDPKWGSFVDTQAFLTYSATAQLLF